MPRQPGFNLPRVPSSGEEDGDEIRVRTVDTDEQLILFLLSMNRINLSITAKSDTADPFSNYST